MKRFCSSFIIVLVLFLVSVNSYAAQKASIGILDFDVVNQQQLPKGVSTLVPEWLSSYLVKSNRFVVLERARLYQIIKEKDIERLDVFDSEKIKTYSSLIGADSIIYGSIVHKGNSGQSSFYSKLFSDKETGTIEINVKIVNLKTGEILFSDSVYNDDPTALEASTEKLANKIMAKLPVKGIILDLASNKDVIMDIGDNDGVNEGDVLEVIYPGKLIKHPVSGEMIALPEKQLAEIQVDEVHNKTSKGKIVNFKSSVGEDIKVGFLVQSTPVKTYNLAKNLRRYNSIFSSTTGMGYVGLASSQGGAADINPAALPQIYNSEVSLEWKYNNASYTSQKNGNSYSGKNTYGSFKPNPAFPHALNFSTLFGNGVAMGLSMQTDSLLYNKTDDVFLDNGDFNYTLSLGKALNPYFMLGAALAGNEYWHTYEQASVTDNYSYRGKYYSMKLGVLIRPDSAIRLGAMCNVPFEATGKYTVGGTSGTFKERRGSEWGVGLIYYMMESLSVGLDLLSKNREGMETFYETHMGAAWDAKFATFTFGTYQKMNNVPDLLSDPNLNSSYSIVRQYYTLGVAKKFDNLQIEAAIEKGNLVNPALIRPNLTDKTKEVKLMAVRDTKFTIKAGTSF